jgi:PAS domain S-box-containing protein
LSEQNSILSAQKEELKSQSGKLISVNKELITVNLNLGHSNQELEKYKNHLEDLVESRTVALKKSETRFRSIFENANDAIFIIKDDIFLDCNLKTTEIFGCRREQIIGKTPYNFSPPFQPDGSDSEESATKKINNALRGVPQRFEWKHIRMDGSTFDAEVSLNCIEVDNQLLLLALVRDITARKKAEQALIKSEEKFNKAFNLSPNMIALTNRSQGGKFIDVNDAFERKTGYKRNEVLGRTVEEIKFWADSREYEVFKKLVKNGNSVYDFEFQFRNKNGEVGIGLLSSDAILLDGTTFALSTVVDITERKRAEKALIDSEKNFRSIFNKSRNGIIIVGSDMRILAANRVASELSGFVLGDDPLYAGDLVLPNQMSQMKERIAVLAKGENLSPFEYKAKFKDGSVHIIETESSLMEFYGQNAILVMLRDVTLIREAEHRVREAIINTEESERSRIAQDLHDGLGPILSTIKIYFQVYQDTKDESKKMILNKKLKSTIDEAIKGVSEISHNISPHVLRNYGFYAALKQFIHRIALTNVINFNLDCGLEQDLNKNTEIILYRAIAELINNSIKHSGCKSISITLNHIDDSLQVNYSDDGKGFDAAAVLEKPAMGSGVQNIINRINALQGNVEMNSTEGKGMHALLRIPV